MENFGKKIKELRKKAGFSQKEFAQALNISPPNLSQWESMAIPPLEGIMKICNKINMPLWRFFMDNKSQLEEYSLDWIKQEYIEFLQKINELPENIQKQLLKNFSEIISVRKIL